jgi:hypothetical protein
MPHSPEVTMIAAPTCSHHRPHRLTATGPDSATAPTKTAAGLLVEAELLAARTPDDHRAAADRLLEDLRFGLATGDGADGEIGPEGLLAGLAVLAELRKLGG